jgi:hypothetical protein
MTVANRLRVSMVRETTPGTTPTTPRMRKKRLTGEALTFAPEFLDSDELRDDRMMGDPMLIMQAAAGTTRARIRSSTAPPSTTRGATPRSGSTTVSPIP